jgi:hypothetical protein
MRYNHLIRLAVFLAGISLGLAACTVVGGPGDEATATLEPTASIAGLPVVPSQACQVAEQAMIRVENPQGNLIAWSPVADTIAYIASTQGSSWNVGELNILSAPKFDTPDRLATQVAGELTWAPDASSLAYLGLRRSDNLYTIGLAYPNGRASIDLFPGEAARTDNYSSEKSILEWRSAGQLRVLISCGINCLQTLDIGVLSGLSTKVGDPIERPWDMWAPHTYHPSPIPTQYSGLTGQLNWSWDNQRIAYIDNNANAWVINLASGTLFSLDIGQYASATETDWSFDNQYLAVQVDQYLRVYSFNCP